MNTTKIIAAVAISLAAASAAHAGPGTVYPDKIDNFAASTTSRAAVKADVIKAQAKGELAVADFKAPATASTRSTRTRAEVRSEALTASSDKVPSYYFN